MTINLAMEMPDYLITSLPYIALVAVLGIVSLIILLLRMRGEKKSSTKLCPHCKQIIAVKETECGFCHRMIA